MEKKIIIEEFVRGEKPERGPRREERNDRGEFERRPRRDERNIHVEKFVRPPRSKRDEDRLYHPHRPEKKRITKLFTSKDEMVKYVNETGEQGHQIDIFKIEDDLYKVVVLEAPKRRPRVEKLREV